MLNAPLRALSVLGRPKKRFAEFETRFSEFQAKIEQRLAEARVEVADRHAKMMRSMFGFWVGTVVPLAGLIVALRFF